MPKRGLWDQNVYLLVCQSTFFTTKSSIVEFKVIRLKQDSFS